MDFYSTFFRLFIYGCIHFENETCLQKYCVMTSIRSNRDRRKNKASGVITYKTHMKILLSMLDFFKNVHDKLQRTLIMRGGRNAITTIKKPFLKQ